MPAEIAERDASRMVSGMMTQLDVADKVSVCRGLAQYISLVSPIDSSRCLLYLFAPPANIEAVSRDKHSPKHNQPSCE